MQEAIPEGMGLMAAVIGLERNSVDQICASVSSGYVSPANYNSPGQIVIAGEIKAVKDAIELLREAGAKKVVPLAVSAPSHCKLMVEASARLGRLLETITFNKSVVPVVNNADAALLTDGDALKLSLIKQLSSPLLWEDSVKNMVRNGVDTFVEVGPGRVLSGLIRRIEPSVKIYNVGDIDSLNKTVDSIAAEN